MGFFICLSRLIEELNGEQEVSIENKVAQVHQQLKSGEAMVFFSELHESVTIISKAEFVALQADPEYQASFND